MYENIITQLTETFKEDFELVRGDLGAIEQTVQQKLQLLGQGLLQRLVSQQTNGYRGSSIYCQCGGSMKFMQHRGRNVHTILGWIKINRAYYHCPSCGTGLAPYDKASGLGSEQLSPGLAMACCLLAVTTALSRSHRRLNNFLASVFVMTQSSK